MVKSEIVKSVIYNDGSIERRTKIWIKSDVVNPHRLWSELQRCMEGQRSSGVLLYKRIVVHVIPRWPVMQVPSYVEVWDGKPMRG